MLDISLLGEARVAVDSTPVALRSSRVMELLGFLRSVPDMRRTGGGRPTDFKEQP
jgi:hypothetical protein